ncbi:ISL3 family transposase [Nonomuraea maheshkhaliensis]|uniref:ISL3 family transposase n=1 Tax=Nonomuraea maheshkhaliensis TaxID=419590 RepID=A0ABN2HDA0_9ACTN
MHDRYQRRLQDVSCGGRPIQVALEVRRFVCGSGSCPVVTFAEQVDGLTAKHQRRTVGLRGLLERVALALAGSAGSRLASAMGQVVSRFTLIRMIRALPDPEVGQVTVLGVDDFAKRKGASYATVLLDMDSHQVIDVLDGREAGTFADWLRAHPGIEVICRDRGGSYALGARQGAPDAQQVADRFHLLQDLGKAVEKTVIAHHAALHDPDPDPQHGQPAPTAAAPHPAEPGADLARPPAEPDGYRDGAGQPRRLVARHTERYQAVQALLATGLSLSAIGRELGLNRQTIARFARAESLEQVLFKATHRAGILDDFKPYLHQRWNQGVTNAAALHAEIKSRGWQGSAEAVRAYLRQYRPDPADDRQRPRQAPTTVAPPKPRRVVRWIMTHPDHLKEAEAGHLARILDRSPELAATAGHVRAFATMLTERTGRQHLDDWLTAVRADPLPALHSLANGIERDHAAVLAGLTLPYSSGAVEGTICKIKFWKRLMFGRANLDLLRKMALHN